MADEPQPSDSNPENSPQDHLEKEEPISIYQKLALLNAAEKVKLALLGSREERQILIRDPNRLVYAAALQSPKLTVPEVDKIANMKNVNDDVLRIIAENRDWVSHYSIALALVRNPKTPIPVALKFVPRLLDRDVRKLSRDKTVSDPVRKMAVRIVQAKKL